MDLIYTDKNGIDKDIMPTYELDVAFGRDENDFLCTIAIEDHCCAPQDRIYMKDSVDGKNKWTNIGGIIGLMGTIIQAVQDIFMFILSFVVAIRVLY